jgi:hypothetical protein
MRIPVGKKFLVEITAPRGVGASQIVRVYRKMFLFRRRLTSDWFFSREEAERFARKVASDLALRETGTPMQAPVLR